MLCFTMLFGAIAEEKKLDKTKADKSLQLTLATQHCNDIAKRITEPFELISAFNSNYTIDDLSKARDLNLKQDMMLYMWGRPDVANFTFIIPKYATVMRRPQFIKFNSIMMLLLYERSGFKQSGFPFHGNCIAEVREDDKIIMPLAFGTERLELEYKIVKEPEVILIEDLLISGESLKQKYRKNLSNQMQFESVDKAIQDLCNQSEYPHLKC